MNDETNQTVGNAAGAEAGGADSAGTEAGGGKEPAKKSPGKGEKAAPLTAEDVSAMIRDSLAAFGKQQEAARTEAEKLAGMNDQERAAYERDSYKSQLDELRQKMTRSEMQSTARAMLSEKGLHVPDGIVERLVTGEAETTKQNVEAFSQLFSDAVEDAVKARLRGETPTRGKPNARMTKEQILAIADDGQRVKAIRENMDLFQ